MYLSPYVEEPLNSKVIKSFVPELVRSRKCFLCFEIPMFYLYGHSMYVSHIAISLLWYIFSLLVWHTAGSMVHTMRIELTSNYLLAKLADHSIEHTK